MSSSSALDEDKIILATEAKKNQNYRCLECRHTVRLRGGMHRQNHFYHLKAHRNCRQHKKSLTHLQTQLFLLAHLPKGEACIERPFPEIGRIADVAWIKEKIIFEIQFSFIDHIETAARIRDYHKLGFRVVWVLHHKRFNKRFLSRAENLLRTQHLCYFTNITPYGQGMIYDQFEVIQNSRREFRGQPLKIHPARPLSSKERPLYFQGDLFDHCSRASPGQLAWMDAIRRRYKPSLALALKKGYASLFHHLLESLAE